MTLDRAIASLNQYAEYGVPTGGFLQAVLSNDLMSAVSRADESSMANLLAIARYVYNDLPSNCHGSPEIVAAWVVRKLEERQMREADNR